MVACTSLFCALSHHSLVEVLNNLRLRFKCLNVSIFCTVLLEYSLVLLPSRKGARILSVFERVSFVRLPHCANVCRVFISAGAGGTLVAFLHSDRAVDVYSLRLVGLVKGVC